MDPLLQFLMVIAAANVILLPPFIYACHLIDWALEKWWHG